MEQHAAKSRVPAPMSGRDRSVCHPLPALAPLNRPLAAILTATLAALVFRWRGGTSGVVIDVAEAGAPPRRVTLDVAPGQTLARLADAAALAAGGPGDDHGPGDGHGPDMADIMLDLGGGPKRGIGAPIACHVDPLHWNGEAPGLWIAIDRGRCRTPLDEADVEDMADAALCLLRAALDDPDCPVEQVDLVGPALRHRLLVETNGPRVPYAIDTTALHLFQDQAFRHPGRPALTHDGVAVSYGALDDAADLLARQLRTAGVAKGDLVAMLLPNGLDLPLAMIALMKLGAAFVPMDDGWQKPRVQGLLAALSPPLVLCRDPALVPEAFRAVRVDLADLLASPDLHADRLPDQGVVAGDLIYGFYTSGSTGLPKCALNLHHGLLNRFGVMTRRFAANGAAPVVLQNSRHVFDSSIWQLLWPLTIGGHVVIPKTGGVLDLASTIATIQAHRIEMTDFVPSIFNALVDLLAAEPDQAQRLASLRHLLIGGEEIDPRAVRRFRRMLPGVGIVNTYGPTEASIGSIFHHVTDEDDRVIPIGTPIDNTFAVVRDERGLLTPPGAIGEIQIGGDCLGAGYLGEPDKTAAAFIDNPFTDIPGHQLYRTGDLGFWRRDGRLGYVGRLDNQVKIGGVRIELAEIELVLAGHPDIRATRVVVFDQGATRELVACVVLRGDAAGRDQDAIALRRFLAGRLPRYCVPQRILFLDALPLNPNGKVDRKALARIAAERVQDAAGASASLGDDTLAAVAGRWRSALHLAPMAPDDGFFDLGGTSLTALVLALDLSRHFSLRITAEDIFRHQTLGAMAALIDHRRLRPDIALGHASTGRAGDAGQVPDIVLAPDIRPAPSGAPRTGGRACVLLTGATGFVGVHLLQALLARPAVDVVCLIRAGDAAAAAARLEEASRAAGYASPLGSARVRVLAGDLASPALGLPPAPYQALADEIDEIVHAGALVNMLHGYDAHAAANVGGVETLLRLAGQGRPKMLHHLSTLSVFAREPGPGPVSEAMTADRRVLPRDGYSQSKWVAEHLVDQARGRGFAVNLYRLGEMLPHGISGHGNPRAVPDLLMAACLRLGLRFPTALRFDYSPVDIACRFIAGRVGGAADMADDAARFHLHGLSTSFAAVLDEAEAHGFRLSRVSYPVFHARLTDAFETGRDTMLGAALAVLPQPAPGGGAIDDDAVAGLIVDKDLLFGCTATRAAMADAGLVWPAVDRVLLAPWFERQRDLASAADAASVGVP